MQGLTADQLVSTNKVVSMLMKEDMVLASNVTSAKLLDVVRDAVIHGEAAYNVTVTGSELDDLFPLDIELVKLPRQEFLRVTYRGRKHYKPLLAD